MEPEEQEAANELGARLEREARANPFGAWLALALTMGLVTMFIVMLGTHTTSAQ